MEGKIETLKRDAAKAGYDVQMDVDGTVRIVRTVKLNKTATRKSGLVIWPDGTAYDIEVDGSAAKGLRSVAAMREVLGI